MQSRLYCIRSSCLSEKIGEKVQKFPKIGIFIIYNALSLFKIHTSLLYLSVKISNFEVRGTFFICIRHLLLYPFLTPCEKIYMWRDVEAIASTYVPTNISFESNYICWLCIYLECRRLSTKSQFCNNTTFTRNLLHYLCSFWMNAEINLY